MKLYRAVVEDNNDDLKLGRVKVRIHGLHTKDNENSGIFSSIKTADLPWAQVMGGTSFGLVGGVGTSSVLRQGTWVWVILEEDNPNKPIVIGTLIGKNSSDSAGKYSGGEGFYDPDEVYPHSERKLTPMKDDRTVGDSGSRADRSDLHPLLDDKYPTLATLETESGHLIELDDTPGDERIKVTHTTGSFILIDKNGDIFVNGVRDIQYNIVRNATWHIGGNVVMNVAGADGIDINATGGDILIDANTDIHLNKDRA